MNFIRKPIDIENLIVAIEKGLEKLSITRALRLRNQEIDFARQMIARITQQREIIVNLKDYVLKDMLHFAQELVISLAVPILVFDTALQARFVNPKSKSPLSLPGAAEGDIDTLLKEMGIETPYTQIKDVLSPRVKECFVQMAQHEKLDIGSELSATLISLKLVKGRINDCRIVALLHKRR